MTVEAVYAPPLTSVRCSIRVRLETISVPEDTVAGTDIGDPITAVDGDANDKLAYSLDTASATVFTIVAGNRPTTNQGRPRITRSENSYSVMVTARDPRGATATTTVTINVTDVDEPPGKPDAPKVTAKTGTHDVLNRGVGCPNEHRTRHHILCRPVPEA